jgi:hypothetical protein
MAQKIRAILVDPGTETLTEIQLNANDVPHVRTVLGVDLDDPDLMIGGYTFLSVANKNGHADMVLVPWFRKEDPRYPWDGDDLHRDGPLPPLCSRALIVGMDFNTSSYIDAAVSVQDLHRYIAFQVYQGRKPSPFQGSVR